MTGKEFAGWMEAVGMSLADASSLFGVSEQTLYNWRSTSGVPASKVEWVRSRMAEYLAGRGGMPLPERLTLEVSPEQFDDWNRAALASGKILRAWAIATLDEAAEVGPTGLPDASNPLQSLPLVAEEGKDYRTHSTSRDAGTASHGSSSPGETASEVA